MTKIAIVGANGQVGTEVCLRLNSVDDVQVIAVARNVSGSAFLRLHGIECRHGLIANPSEASGLIGDCDVVVNFALSATAVPRVDRNVNREITRDVVRAAKPGAPILFASTIMVYAPSAKYRIPDSYGFEKLFTERLFRRLCRTSHHPAFIFRLGHVLGELQGITGKICQEIRRGPVALPRAGQTGSNTVFVAAIVEAIVRVAKHSAKAGTYDLITFPQWSWLDVYRHYAQQLGLPLQLAAARGDKSNSQGRASATRRFLRYLANHQGLRERLLFGLAFLPRRMNERVHLLYLQTRAHSEISALRQSKQVESCVPDWRELQVHPFEPMPDPVTLSARYPLPADLESLPV